MSGQEGRGAHQSSCQAQAPGLQDPCPHLCSPRPRAMAAPARPSLGPWEPLASCHHITPPDLELALQIKHTLITHRRIVNVIY